MNDKEVFWMVWSPQGSTPTYRHESEDSARMEAVRLARIHASHTFFVLKALCSYSMPIPGVPCTELQDLPY